MRVRQLQALNEGVRRVSQIGLHPLWNVENTAAEEGSSVSCEALEVIVSLVYAEFLGDRGSMQISSSKDGVCPLALLYVRDL